MYNIKLLNTIAPAGLSHFPEELYQVSPTIAQPDAILVRSENMHDLVIPPSLKVIGRAGAGVNNIPVAELTTLGIPVLTTPGANANAVRELVIAGMLIASRNICSAWNYVNQLTKDNDLENQVESNKKQFVGFELAGKKLAVIGLGNVGVKVANTAIAFGMHVAGYDPAITIHHAWELSSAVEHAANFEQLLIDADFISVHVPLTNTTRGMIDAEKIQLIKQGAILLNFSRAAIVDETAILAALNEKRLAFYVNDFPSLTLGDHANVISLPHLGASTKEAEENCAVMIVKQIRHFFENGNITNAVNFPAINMPRQVDCARLAIVNANIPNMVAQMSTAIATHNLNIVGLSNGSFENIAYTLIDVCGSVTESLLKKLSSIKGVMHIRLL